MQEEFVKISEEAINQKAPIYRGNGMIVLLTGASHTGKTALAQKLLEKYKYPYLSMEDLK